MKVRHNGTGKEHTLPKAEFDKLVQSVPSGTYTVISADDEKLPAELKPKEAKTSKPADSSADSKE